jgi:hypothetical protein
MVVSPAPTPTSGGAQFSEIPGGLETPGAGPGDTPGFEAEAEGSDKKKKKKVDPKLGQYYYDKMSKDRTESHSECATARSSAGLGWVGWDISR